MSRQWKPGDFAMIRPLVNPAVECEAIRTEDEDWACAHKRGHAKEARPLVVIDPESADQVERLIRLFLANDCDDCDDVRAMQDALREFADPTPPKVDEPLGLGAVVEANFATDSGKGFGPAHWAKAGDGAWVCLTDGHAGRGAAWPFLTNIRVLSEGIS